MPKNPELELAYNFVQYTDKNIFLTGKAGTGKTTFLRNLRSKSLKRLVIVAPTGVAAINAGGVTIHSFFQIPFGPYIAQSVSGNKGSADTQRQRKFNREKINLLQSLDLLVIDEISMVRADTLDAIDEVLRRYKHKHKPFGGVQLLMIGDLHQLSPVIKDEDWRLLGNYYPNLYFFSSAALQQTLPVCIELKHIYRQSDTHFIDILNCIRENRIDQKLLSVLNQRFIPEFNPEDNEGYITLTTHNHSAQEINLAKLAELKSSTSIFSAKVTGDFPEYSYPTDVRLELKIGAQVMFVKNDPSREKQFYNGKIGKVTRIEGDKIFVQCSGDNREIEVVQSEWNNLAYELNQENKEIQEKILGSFTQYPLKLAWAITIHKSQGLTFEKAIIDANASFAHGQVYVALSRCKSFEGIVLRSPISLNSVKTDGTISVYTKNAEQNAPNEQHLLESKISFQKSLLQELFDFTPLKTRMFYFKKVVEENDAVLASSAVDQVNAIRESAEKELYNVSEVFLRELGRLSTSNILPEENAELQERVTKGAVYFFEKLQKNVFEVLASIRIDTDNKAIRKSIDEAFEHLRKEVVIKLSVLDQSKKSFNTISYLKTKANTEIDYNSVQSVPAPKTPAVSGVPNFGLYEILKKWRDNIARENNQPVYMVLPSKVLVELVSVLPSSLPELETVKGIGKQKVRQFGKEVLEIINTYCEDKGVERGAIQIQVKDESVKADTRRVSLDLFRSGKTVEAIAEERGLTRGTIETHLTHFIVTGEIDLLEVVSKEKADLISGFIEKNRPESASAIKMALGDGVTYGEIRAVINHLKLTDA